MAAAVSVAKSSKNITAAVAAMPSVVGQKFVVGGGLGTLAEKPSTQISSHSVARRSAMRGRKLSREERRELKQNFRRENFFERKYLQDNFLVGGYDKIYRRIKECGTRPHGGSVSVLLDSVHQTAHFGGLVTCGSVWACPVCSEKIMQRRRAEIAEIIDAAWDRGHKASLITFTHPHEHGEALSDLIWRHKSAMSAFHSGRWWQKNFSLNDDLGYDGWIRSNEITVGLENGWHWHTHFLLISDNPEAVDVGAMIEHWIDLYAKYCAKQGKMLDEKTREYMREHSVDYMPICHSSDYLTKTDKGYWGADKELTGGARKQAKMEVGLHYTPRDLIAMGRRDLYMEYVDATYGVQRVRYSDGLRQKYGVAEKTDEQLAVEEQAHSVVVATIFMQDWRIIYRRNWLAIILEIVEDFGVEVLEVWARAQGFNFVFGGGVDPPPDG